MKETIWIITCQLKETLFNKNSLLRTREDGTKYYDTSIFIPIHFTFRTKTAWEQKIKHLQEIKTCNYTTTEVEIFSFAMPEINENT